MDPSQLSDDELRALVAQKRAAAAPAKAPTDMSDDELRAAVAQKRAATTPDANALPVINEQHDAISWADRLLAKNFTSDNTDASMAAYLKKIHPDLDIKADPTGQVLIRRPDEKAYHVLDPQNGLATLLHPTELVQDATDSAFDLLSGLGVSAATTAGGIAGAPSVVGALPAAAAAGAGASTVAEGARQGLGKLLGVNQADSPDWGQLKAAFGTGAIAPFLFGTGAAKGAVQNAVAKRLGADATAEALAEGTKAALDSQRGAFGRAWSGAKNTVIPWVGSKMSGLDSGMLKAGAKNLDFIKEAEKTGISDFTNAAHDEITDAFSTATQDLGQKLGTAMRESGAEFDTTKIKQPLDDLLAQYKAIAAKAPTEANNARVAAVEGIIEKNFGKEKIVKEVVEAAPGMAGVGFTGKKVVDRVIPAALADSADASTVMALKDDMADLAEFGKGTGMLGAISRLFNSNATDKRAASAASKAYSEINKQIDEQLVGHADLRQQFKELSTLKKMLGGKFSSPESTYKTLRGLGGKNRRYTLEQLQSLDKNFGTNTLDAAEKLQALSAFGNEPSALATSMKGATSTLRGGSLGFVGAGLAENALPDDTSPAVRNLVKPLGFILGGAAGSPAAMRAVMSMNHSAGNAAAAQFLRPTIKGVQTSIPNVVGQELTDSAWNAVANMQKKRKDQ